jgi:hypothetical protein
MADNFTVGVDLGGVKNTVVGLAETANRYYVKGETWIQWVSADGVASKTLVRSIAKNALVRRYKVSVGAARADGTTLANAGQVRLQAETGGAKIIVVDFGMLRTVSGVGRVGGAGAPSMTICSLRGFKGDGFDTVDLYFEDCFTTDPDGMMIRSAEANSFETRTDRVRLKIKSDASLQALSNAVFLQFPDLPSDLDIRVNGGATAFTAPGVAQPNTRGWDANTRQEVDLTAALAALGGDPRDASPLDATIVLSSRIPGILELDEAQVDIAYLARVAFGSSEETTLVFDEEGQKDVVLNLPSWAAHVQEVRFTLTGTVPAERILEPVGPPRALRSGGDGAAYDLLLDVDHAGAVRLDPASPLAELTGVRLPLRAGVDGAEVRAVLYTGTADGPTAPADGGTSKPVDLPPGASSLDDVFTTFSFASPIKLQPALTYWVATVVGRGVVSWSLGRFAAPLVPVPLRRGAPSGPWHPLPTLAVDGDTLGGRVRAVGKAPAPAPVAPLTVTVVGHENSHIDVTPTAKGVPGTWLAPGTVSGTNHPSITPAGSAITLRFTSRMTGTVKLSAVDVVATK